MKKFLGKKPVWICFIIAAVIFLEVEIGILVRPVSYGLNYTMKDGKDKSIVKIHSDSVARNIEITDGDKMVADMWIYRDGHKLYMIGIKEYVDISDMDPAIAEIMKQQMPEMKKDDYKEIIKTIKDAKEEGKTEYELTLATLTKYMGEFGIFEAMEGEAKCPQAIAFVVIHGAFTVALITFAVLSTIVVVKKKKA